MPSSAKELDQSLSSLVETTDAILRGDFSRKAMVVDTEGLLSTLAQKINAMIVNLKTVEMPLASAGQHAPDAVADARTVVDLMAQSTDVVLDQSDKLLTLVTDLADRLHTGRGGNASETTINALNATIYDIIASQSYQDAARQKMERLIGDLGQIRGWLLEALVVLNINRDDSPENIQKKAELLREVARPADAESLKQDLVDDLLAEFGF